MIIDLSNYLKDKRLILSGEESGSSIRQMLDLDSIDKTNKSVIIKIPDNIFCMTTSFFIGLFGPSVIKLGKYRFNYKYKFVCNEMIYNTIKDGINRLLNKNILGGI